MQIAVFAPLTFRPTWRVTRTTRPVLFMVFGILPVALGLKQTLIDIDAPMTTFVHAALFGGMALYFLAHVAFRLRKLLTVTVQVLIFPSHPA